MPSFVKRGKTWTVIISLEKDPITKKGKQKWLSGFATKKAAAEAAAEYMTKVKRGEVVDATSISLATYLERWLRDYCKHNLAPRTYESYEERINLHLTPRLGDIPMQKLRPSHIQQYYSKAMIDKKQGGDGLSGTTVLYHHRILHHALKQAVQWQVIYMNPSDAVKPPKKTTKKKPPFTTEEAEKILEISYGTEMYIPIVLGLEAGLCRAEISGLQTEDLNYRKKTLHIHQIYHRVNREMVIGATKRESRERTIALWDSTLKALKEYDRNKEINITRFGDRYNLNNFLCVWPDGHPMDPDHYSKKFKKLLNKLEIHGNYTFHSLRHTHATWLLEENIHPKVVQERLGHSSSNVTLDTYSHVTLGIQKKAMESVGSKIGLAKD